MTDYIVETQDDKNGIWTKVRKFEEPECRYRIQECSFLFFSWKCKQITADDDRNHEIDCIKIKEDAIEFAKSLTGCVRVRKYDFFVSGHKHDKIIWKNGL